MADIDKQIEEYLLSHKKQLSRLSKEGAARVAYLSGFLAAQSALTTRLQEAEAVIKSGQVLVLKMYEVYDDSQYRAAFSLLHDHQGQYSGKTWTKEQDDFTARAAAWLKGGTE